MRAFLALAHCVVCCHFLTGQNGGGKQIQNRYNFQHPFYDAIMYLLGVCDAARRKLTGTPNAMATFLRPAEAYPGWYVTATVEWPEVWVMNHISFTKALVKYHALIEDADIHLITYHLKRYVITREKQAKVAR